LPEITRPADPAAILQGGFEREAAAFCSEPSQHLHNSSCGRNEGQPFIVIVLNGKTAGKGERCATFFYRRICAHSNSNFCNATLLISRKSNSTGLEAAHQGKKGIIHRDLFKAGGNVFIN